MIDDLKTSVFMALPLFAKVWLRLHGAWLKETWPRPSGRATAAEHGTAAC